MEKQVTLIATNKKVKVRKQLHIHHDIAFSILSKLSIKPLKRFKCVSKSWSILFDSPYFMSFYSKNLLTKDHSFYDDTSVLLHQLFNSYLYNRFELYSLYEEKISSNVKIDWPYCDCGFRIVGCGSIHGIFCLSFIFHNDILLWNPSTKEFKIIPPTGHYKSYQRKLVDCGFGYDRVKDDYKVMCIYYGEFFLCEIFSLRNNSWKKIDVGSEHNSSFWGSELVYMDGFSYRLCKAKTETRDETYLLSFDWSREVFSTTVIPFDIDDITDFLYGWSHLMLLNGSIALVLYFKATSTFNIFILGELGVKESWTKILTIKSLSCLQHPIGMGKKSDMLFRKKDGSIVWFDLITQKIKDLSITTDKLSCCNIVVHRENPISLVAFEGKIKNQVVSS